MRTLNLGILAHVDAGKTSLTERLLHTAGVIDEIGRVDDGTTQTDTLALERQRGITIKAAVVSFVVGDLTINLIDTPGHPDFIAEVERALSVLDGAVLVLSAVEGVQSQTRVLFRALKRLKVPTILFVNKTDRLGADVDRVVRQVHERLAADLTHPVFAGSAKTGDGLDALIEGITTLLPARKGDREGPVSGTVFKIERGRAGEKLAYVRMFSGTVRIRDRFDTGRVTGIEVLGRSAQSVSAGYIGKLRGLADARIGDAIGALPPVASHNFTPPTLETVIAPRDGADAGAMHVALVQLAEQDPLIDLRQDDARGETYVSLYGEVQKEVIEQTLADDFGVAVTFRETTPICIERVVGTGEAAERMGEHHNPFLASIGLRVEPAAPGSGVHLDVDVKIETIPRFVYKSVELYRRAMEKYACDALRQGLRGWHVPDCVVTVIESDYSSPGSLAADFRQLMPLVLLRALKHAGTVVCEPVHRFRLDVPADVLGAALRAIVAARGVPDPPVLDGSTETMATIEGVIPAARVHALQQQIPGMSRGEGVVESAFDSYRPTTGPVPSRPRTDHNPLDRREYLASVRRS